MSDVPSGQMVQVRLMKELPAIPDNTGEESHDLRPFTFRVINVTVQLEYLNRTFQAPATMFFIAIV